MLQRTLIVLAAAAIAAPALAQSNPRGEAKATLAGKTVSIEYGRPSLKGRDMLGEAKVGSPWRLGADGATTLETETDLAFGDAKLPKGKYILRATKVSEGQWQLNVHRPSAENARQHGEKVADVPLAASTLPEPVETFTIELSGQDKKGELALKWGTAAFKAPFSAE
jgi:hypothetical protein